MAATITVTNAQISKPTDRYQVGETDALIAYKAVAKWNKQKNQQNPGPSGGGYSCTSTWKTYEYEADPPKDATWYFEPGGTATGLSGEEGHFVNLSRGEKNTLSAKVQVRGTEITITHSQSYSRERYPGYYTNPGSGKPGEEGYIPPSGWVPPSWGSWEKSGPETTSRSSSIIQSELTSASSTIDVWTRPGAMKTYTNSTTFEPKTYIKQHLTAGWVADWVKHMNKVGHWYNQSDADVANHCLVASNDWILASWYNACANCIRIYAEKDIANVTQGGPKVYTSTSYITAAKINALADKNDKSGPAGSA